MYNSVRDIFSKKDLFFGKFTKSSFNEKTCLSSFPIIYKRKEPSSHCLSMTVPSFSKNKYFIFDFGINFF